MYYCIKNTGEADFRSLRLLGASSKRNSDNSAKSQYIGQFGSGFKYVLAMLARLEVETIIFIGEFRINLDVIDDEIVFKPQDGSGSIISSSIHKAFGAFDWNDPWFIFRDLICNAIDAETEYKEKNKLDGDGFTFGDEEEPKGAKGQTRIYFKLNNTLMITKLKIGDNFVLDRPSTYKVNKKGIKIHRGCEDKIYKKGVFVQEYKKLSKLKFGYDFTDLKLNESRTADISNISVAVSSAISNVDDVMYYVEIFKDETCQEIKEHPSYVYDEKIRQKIKEAFMLVHGDCVIINIHTSQKAIETIKLKGKIPIIAPDAWSSTLVHCDVPYVSSVISDQLNDQNLKLEEEKNWQLHNIFREFISQYFESSEIPKILPDIKLYTHTDSNHRGFYSDRDNLIGINKQYYSDLENPTLSDLTIDCKITLFEECCHCFLKLRDNDREMQEYLMRRIIQ